MADLAQLNITPDTITDDDKLWGALCYAVPLVALLVIFAMEDKKARPFVRFHAVQSITASIAITVLGTITCGFGYVLGIVLWLYAYQAYNGQVMEIPVITDQLMQRGYFDGVKQLTGGRGM